MNSPEQRYLKWRIIVRGILIFILITGIILTKVIHDSSKGKSMYRGLYITYLAVRPLTATQLSKVRHALKFGFD